MAMPSARLLAVQHTRHGAPRRLGEWMADEGIDVTVVRAFDGETVPQVSTPDALLVLGGGYLPDDDERAPWLPAIRALVQRALHDGRPLLGICLGGQLLAHVAGGTVRPNAGMPEHGSTTIRLRTQARSDPLFCGLPPTAPAIEHHVDAITVLPPGAVWLAETHSCPYQAFRVGTAAWGVQFHPEAPPDAVLNWNADDLAARGLDRATLYGRARADDEAAQRAWRQLAANFAALVRAGAGR